MIKPYTEFKNEPLVPFSAVNLQTRVDTGFEASIVRLRTLSNFVFRGIKPA
jgi:hypothetical protein